MADVSQRVLEMGSLWSVLLPLWLQVQYGRVWLSGWLLHCCSVAAPGVWGPWGSPERDPSWERPLPRWRQWKPVSLPFKSVTSQKPQKLACGKAGQADDKASPSGSALGVHRLSCSCACRVLFLSLPLLPLLPPPSSSLLSPISYSHLFSPLDFLPLSLLVFLPIPARSPGS